MNRWHRLTNRGAVFVTGLTLAAFTVGFSSSATATTPPRFAVVGDSAATNGNADVGAFSSARMSVEVVLAPRAQAELNHALAAVYDPTSGHYQNWLAKGQFEQRYAPTAQTRDGVVAYLRASGLTMSDSGSPFLVRAVGSSQAISAAFGTPLRTYRNAAGVRYFANSAQVRVPRGIASGVLGVLGLTDTVRLHTALVSPRTTSARQPSGCAAPYPTTQAVLDAGGVFFRGYGGSPGCNGLTPQQVDSIYGAPHVGLRGAGAGVNVGLFEESAYRQSDIATWVHQFYGPKVHAPLVDVPVDGGSLTPLCPAGDSCPAGQQGYAGDIEVTADVEESLTVAPNAAHVLVYDAPFDLTGQTALDEFTAMADDDAAATVSTSWGFCEGDISSAYAQAENVVFEQMALQGQSVFSASGDSGAFDCLDEDGGTGVLVDDPSGQPWVTGVGGTSLETADPGTNQHPAYPAGVETAWNVHNLCNTSADEGGRSGYYWCARSGAGGGGNSRFWGQPTYQRGPGVDSQFTAHANGTTACVFAAIGTPCREVPDISVNADGFNGYAVFCTGDATTPNSLCATSTTTPSGWTPVGGTSLSSPLWAAIVADRDSYQGRRTGNVNPLLYRLYRTNPALYFHDITGIGAPQAVATNNGLFPALPGYDLATGIGTPRMAQLITQGRF